jgi:predicted metal-binding membrane protein
MAWVLGIGPVDSTCSEAAAIDWSRIDAAQTITMTTAFIVEMSVPDATPPQRTSATEGARWFRLPTP